MPFVSVIIPTFNSGKILSTSLDSLASQTYRDFEVLIIDGLSKDDTLEIAKSYESKLPALQIKSEKDKGIYDAMNKGITEAKGEWIYFLGSDDFLATPTVLEDIFEKEKELVASQDFIYGNVFWGKSSVIYMGVFDEYMIYRSNICHQAIFYRKSVFEITGPFDLRYPALADWKLNMHCLMDPKVKVAYVPHLIAHFAIDGSSKHFKDDFKEDKEHFYQELLSKRSKLDLTRIQLFLFPKIGIEGILQKLHYKWISAFHDT